MYGAELKSSKMVRHIPEEGVIMIIAVIKNNKKQFIIFIITTP